MRLPSPLAGAAPATRRIPHSASSVILLSGIATARPQPLTTRVDLVRADGETFCAPTVLIAPVASGMDLGTSPSRMPEATCSRARFTFDMDGADETPYGLRVRRGTPITDDVRERFAAAYTHKT